MSDYEKKVTKAQDRLMNGEGSNSKALIGVGYAILALAEAIREGLKKKE
jgi:hypothetical protein